MTERINFRGTIIYSAGLLAGPAFMTLYAVLGRLRVDYDLAFADNYERLMNIGVICVVVVGISVCGYTVVTGEQSVPRKLFWVLLTVVLGAFLLLASVMFLWAIGFSEFIEFQEVP